MTLRLAIVVTLLLGTAAATHSVRARVDPPSVALDALPLTMDRWSGADAGALDPETERILAADAYLNRTYVDGSKVPIGLYVAYYAQQRPGVSIHSPLHCLPGTGWEPIDVANRTLDGSQESASLRRLVVRKARDRAVVLYWYAVHGRSTGSEIASKLWLLHDSLVLHRSDAALVRVVVPVTGSVDAAERSGLDFVRDLLPHVSRLWS